MQEKKDFNLKNNIDELDSLKGWIAVGGAFFATFVCFGILYSFGAFFDSMSSEFQVGRSATSAMFGITTFIFLMVGMVSGSATDRLGPKPVLILGGVIMGLGLYLTSLVTSIWVGYITYGLGVGIGVSCGYVPMLAVVSAWFEKRRAVAVGIAVTGIGFGTLLMAPLAANLISRFGWRQTFVIFAVLSSLILVLCGIFMPRPPLAVSQEPKLSKMELIKMPVFRFLYIAAFLNTLAIYFPFVFLIPYARAQGISDVAAATLVGLIGAASVVGRLGFGAMGVRFSSIRLFLSAYFLLAISFSIWLVAGNSYYLLVAFVLVLGTAYGGIIALAPTVSAELFGLVGLGGILGTLYTAAGFAGLVGSPMAGYIIDFTGNYTFAIVVYMIFGLLAWLALVPVQRIMRR